MGKIALAPVNEAGEDFQGQILQQTAFFHKCERLVRTPFT